MTNEVKFRLALDGAGQAQAGIDGVGEAFAVSATDALKLEKATAAAAVAQAKLEAATAKTARAQEDLARAQANAALFNTTSASSVEKAAQSAALAAAAQAQAAVKYKESIGALKALEAAHAGVATQTRLSGYQTAQLGAQLQDFFVQVQGGANPLTAFAQQFSQVSAVMGGTGNAFKAILSTISPTVVALGSFAAVVGTLAATYRQGSAEDDAFRRGIVLSGNAAGQTAGQLRDLARAQSSVVGTEAKAAEVLAALTAGGNVAAAQIGKVAEAVTRLSREGVAGVDDIAKKFDALGKSPLQTLVQLNQAENFLTRSVYDQVRALEQQHKMAEAAALAQKTYADVGISRAKALETQLGSIERAWRAITDTAAEAWSAMLNVGRKQTPGDQLADLKRQLEANERRTDRADSVGPSGIRKGADSRRAELLEEIKDLQNGTFWEKAWAESKAENAKATKDYIAAQPEAEAARKKAIDDAKRLVEAGKELTQSLQAQAAGLSGGFIDDWGKLGAAYRAGAISLRQLESAQGLLLAQQPAMVAQAKAALEAAQAIADARRKESDGIDAYLQTQQAASQQALASINARIASLSTEGEAMAYARAQNVSLAAAIELVTAARLKERLALVAPGSPAEAALKAEIASREKLGQLIESASVGKAIDEFLNPEKAQAFGDALTKAFEGAGNALVKLSDTLTSYASKQQRIQELAARNAKDPTLDDKPEERIRRQNILIQEQGRLQVDAYASMAGAAKGFFREGTTGYKALEAAETAFRAFQLASNAAAAIASITQSQAIGAASVGPAVAKEGSISGIYGALAMAAILAGFGLAGGRGGSGGGVDVAARQAATGTGTVLGDATAKSESMANALEQLRDTARLELPIQSAMLRSLESIDANTAGLASLIARSAGLTTGANLGIQTGVLSKNDRDPGLALFGINDKTLTKQLFGIGLEDPGGIIATLQGWWGKIKQEIVDSGLSITGRVSDLVAGSGVKQYADVTTTSSSFFGLVKKTSQSTVTQDVDAAIAQQFGLVFKNIGESIKLAAGALGQDSAGIGDAVANTFIDIAKLSLKDLKGQELQDAISAAIGAQADQIAAKVLPGLNDFQLVGEGYFETLVRVASGVETADDALDRFGITAIGFQDILNKQGDVAAEIVRDSIVKIETAAGALTGVGQIVSNLSGSAGDIADVYDSLLDVRGAMKKVGLAAVDLNIALIKSAGGLDPLAAGLEDYFNNFYTKEERTKIGLSNLADDFAALGLTMPKTRAEFRALVDSLAASGSPALGAVLKLSGSFADLVPAAEAAAKAVVSLGAQAQQALFGSGAGNASLSIGGINAAAAAGQQSRDLASIRNAFQQQVLSGTLKFGLQSYVDYRTQKFPEFYTRESFAANGALFNMFAQRYQAAQTTGKPRSSGGGGGKDEPSKAFQEAQDAKNALIEQQNDITRELIRTLDSLEDSLADFQKSLLFGDLSALSPQQQYEQARASVESLKPQVRAGDTAALAATQDAIQTFLQISKSFNGSNAAFAADNAAMVALLKEIQDIMARIETQAALNVKATATGASQQIDLAKEANDLSKQLVKGNKLSKAGDVE